MGYQDEVWFSRYAQPHLHAWTAGKPLALQLHTPPKTGGKTGGKTSGKTGGKTGGKALACYGLLRPDTGEMRLRFVEGRPVSGVTTQFLEWLLEGFAREGKRVLLMFWDNASWHVSGPVRQWIKAHNAHAKKHGGCRLLVCRLPVKSPWLNPIEPRWVHGKKNTVEPGRVLEPEELKQRLCEYYGCPLLKSIEQKPL